MTDLRSNDDYFAKLSDRIEEPGALARLTLWIKLQCGAIPGFRFEPEVEVRGYQIDFYCRRVKLGIEVVADSPEQRNAKEKSRAEARRSALEAQGIILLSFSGHEVAEYTEDVLEHIRILASAFDRIADTG